MSHRSNAAYQQDFQSTSPRRPKRREETRPELTVVQGRKSRVRAALSPRVVVIFLIFVLATCFMVYYQAQLAEVTGEINRLTGQMKQLKSENVRLESVLEPTESPHVLAERATRELGMHRIDYQNQVSYVFIYEEDKIDIAQPEEPEGLVEQVEAAVSSANTLFSSATDDDE